MILSHERDESFSICIVKLLGVLTRNVFDVVLPVNRTNKRDGMIVYDLLLQPTLVGIDLCRARNTMAS